MACCKFDRNNLNLNCNTFIIYIFSPFLLAPIHTSKVTVKVRMLMTLARIKFSAARGAKKGKKETLPSHAVFHGKEGDIPG